jgi:hypothetical protein
MQLFLLGTLAATPGATAHAQLAVDGTEFVLTTADGRVLRSADLAGATLMISEGEDQTAVIIESVEEDPRSVGGDVFLHRFVVTDDSGKESDLCNPDAEGKNLGFPIPNDAGGFELTCTSGAVGKCIRWGYRFWEEEPGGPPLKSLHQACIRMTRADYGGDGETFTRDGTLIEMCDRYGIQTCDWAYPIAFEAAWSVDGAVCVAHPRIAELATLDGLAKEYPHLAGHLGPEACTREIAERDPAALLFNRSEE